MLFFYLATISFQGLTLTLFKRPVDELLAITTAKVYNKFINPIFPFEVSIVEGNSLFFFE